MICASVDTCRAYEQNRIDLILCLVNPFEISHGDVMQTIKLVGKHVLPEFD